MTSASAISQARGGVWRWIPTLYFGQGIPYVAVMTFRSSCVQEPRHLEHRHRAHTSWLYLPFVIKPLWSPFVDMFHSKRWWIVWWSC